MVANSHSMGNMNESIEFCPLADDRIAERASANYRVRTYLHVIFYHDTGDLREPFQFALLISFKTGGLCANNYPRMYDNSFTDPCSSIDIDVAVDYGTVPYFAVSNV